MVLHHAWTLYLVFESQIDTDEVSKSHKFNGHYYHMDHSLIVRNLRSGYILV